MKEFSGSKTEANLKAAFAGESQARSRYYSYAVKAREDGFDDVANCFEETAIHEQEHARIWLRYLNGVGTTAENLTAAIAGESNESGTIYPTFAKTAREEGFDNVALLFENVASIERSHRDSFRRLKENMEAMLPPVDAWKCDTCGNIVTESAAPAVCPVCDNSDIARSGYKAYKQVTI
ncbi:MAG: rubrerythrin family protein [Treponema sp.]|nr:rubrerythrin family protein [Treponema sp.]